MPDWLTPLAVGSLALGVASFVIIAAHILWGHPQRMMVMNLVWPITALYAGPLALWAYFTVGQRSTRKAKEETLPAKEKEKPFWQSVALAATHCGSGCTLGDLLAEGVVMTLVPFTLFGRKMYASWVVDFVLAFLIGVAFQYFTIKPMRNLSPREGLVAALKADALSLAAWQVGMYGWMAIAVFLIFGHELKSSDPIFWFMMQIAMLAGFATSYPVNWWLVSSEIKERM